MDSEATALKPTKSESNTLNPTENRLISTEYSNIKTRRYKSKLPTRKMSTLASRQTITSKVVPKGKKIVNIYK